MSTNTDTSCGYITYDMGRSSNELVRAIGEVFREEKKEKNKVPLHVQRSNWSAAVHGPNKPLRPSFKIRRSPLRQGRGR